MVLTFGGSCIGYTVTVVIPVLFYNAAYSEDRSKSCLEIDSESNQLKIKKRRLIIKLNYVVLLVSFAISSVGFIDSIKEIVNGKYSKK